MVKKLGILRGQRVSKGLCPSQLFVAVSAIGFISVLIAFLLSRGSLMEQYYYPDIRDTGMDFFHSVEYMRGNHPYKVFRVLYPPLANLVFGITYRMIPKNITKHWTWNFDDSVKLRGTKYDLRTFQAPMALYTMFIALSVLLVVLVVCVTLRNKREFVKIAVTCSVLCSYCMLYALERGNIIIISFCFTMGFLLAYDHKNPAFRELGLISLAIAAGLKIYPAIYGIILLQEKRFHAAVRAIIYGLLSVVLPLLCLGEGLEGFTIWLDVLMKSKAITQKGDCSAKKIADSLTEWMPFYGIERTEKLISFLAILICAFIILQSFRAQEKWKRLIFITAATLLYFPQPIYGLIYYFVPLLFCIKAEKKVNRQNVVELILMVLFVANVPAVSYSFIHKIFFYDNLYAFLLLYLVCRNALRIWKHQKAKRLAQSS